MRKWPLGLLLGVMGTRAAWAAEPSAPPPAEPSPAPAASSAGLDVGHTLENDLTAPPPAGAEADEPPLEAPPLPPRHKGVVLQGTLGALFFPGAFGNLSPPAPHLRVALGYEPLRWLLVFAEGELAFASTAVAQDAPHTRSFPLWGFAAGVRGTLPLGSRLGLWLEAAPGLWRAQTATNALGALGFRDAESLGVFVRGRLGLDWYQIDRHAALFVAGGARFAPSFTYTVGPAGLPLIAEANLGLRYTF